MTDRHIKHEVYYARRKAANKKYALKHPERIKESRRLWALKNPDYAKNKAKRDRQQKPERIKAIRLKSRYKVLPSRKCPEYCECCGIPFAETTTHHGACFDHDHKTGKFRGWLCNDCNMGLGRLGDCREGVLRMLDYLDRAELLS